MFEYAITQRAYYHFFLLGEYSPLGISCPRCSHKLSPSRYPSTRYAFSCTFRSKIRSRVNRNRSFTIRGMSCARRGLEHSRQGFSLTSMSQTLSSLSTKKSSPKSSKQFLRWLALTFFLTELKAMQVISLILFQMVSTWCSGRQSLRLAKESWLPSSNWPQCSDCFWMALLVRWMKQLSMSSVEQASAEVRMQPSLKKCTFRSSVSSAHTRISNLRYLIRKGFSTYFWITNEQVFSLNFQPPSLCSGVTISPSTDYPGITSLVAQLLSSSFWSLLSFYFSVRSIVLSWFFSPLSAGFSLIFLRFMRARYSRSILSRSSRESKISMPLPLLRPVGLRSQRQLLSVQQVELLRGRLRMLTLFLMSEFCRAMQFWNLEISWKGQPPFLCLRGSFLRKKARNCFRLYSQYSSSKSRVKVTGVMLNTSIFLVSQQICRFLTSWSLVLISSLNSKWLIARFLLYDHIFLQLCLSLENTHLKFATPSPACTSFQTPRPSRIPRTSSSLLLPLPTRNVSSEARLTLTSSHSSSPSLQWLRRERLVELSRRWGSSSCYFWLSTIFLADSFRILKLCRFI